MTNLALSEPESRAVSCFKILNEQLRKIIENKESRMQKRGCTDISQA